MTSEPRWVTEEKRIANLYFYATEVAENVRTARTIACRLFNPEARLCPEGERILRKTTPRGSYGAPGEA